MVDKPNPPTPVTVVDTNGNIVEIEHVPTSKDITSNVHTLSDITNTTGTNIDPAFYQGDLTLLTNRTVLSKWHKINQPRPGQANNVGWSGKKHATVCATGPGRNADD